MSRCLHDPSPIKRRFEWLSWNSHSFSFVKYWINNVNSRPRVSLFPFHVRCRIITLAADCITPIRKYGCRAAVLPLGNTAAMWNASYSNRAALIHHSAEHTQIQYTQPTFTARRTCWGKSEVTRGISLYQMRMNISATRMNSSKFLTGAVRGD